MASYRNHKFPFLISRGTTELLRLPGPGTGRPSARAQCYVALTYISSVAVHSHHTQIDAIGCVFVLCVQKQSKCLLHTTVHYS